MKNSNFMFILFIAAAILISCQRKYKKPNILFCISDDQSWIHTSFLGAKELKTPGFDRVASQGVYFENAYCAAPSCAPSRASILAGQDIYRLEEGGLLFGALPKEIQIFTDILSNNGYSIGHTAKGYAPANTSDENYSTNLLGEAYNSVLIESPDEINNIDYAANFRLFIEENSQSNKPFFFWFGCTEPHRAYSEGIGRKNGKSLSNIEVPGFLPDSTIIKEDISDYYFEIEWFDNHLSKMIDILKEYDLFDNTLIVVTSDNGMPFPRAKATLYEYGTHLPLAISFGNQIKGSREVKDFISFKDFAPTFLDVAGLAIPEEMTGKSFANILYSEKEGVVDTFRNKVVTAIERHTYCRPGGLPYPSRAIRMNNWVYIRNFEPGRWPAGNPDFDSPHQGYFGDVDEGLSREFILNNRNSPAVKPYFKLAFGKRKKEELYNLDEDPYQLNNLAGKPEFHSQKKELENNLIAYLKETNDPRMNDRSPWDNYPYFFNGYETKHLIPFSER